MTKFMNNLYKYSVWIIIGLSIVGYFAYKTMSFEGTLMAALTDWQSYVNMLFVIWLNVNMVSAAYDTATTQGVNSEEFELADKLNNKIITSVNNEMKEFRKYVKALNQHELITVQEDYLFKIGDKTYEELTEDERKEFDNLTAIRHNIYGFNLPLYYEMTANGEIKYQASTKENEGKRKAQIQKVFNGILFGAMTTNMLFQLGNVGNALVSLLIISIGLVITFLMIYIKRVFKFKYTIPKGVVLKNNLYKSYIAFKNGTHKLKTFELKEEKNEEVVIDSNIDSDVSVDELHENNDTEK